MKITRKQFIDLVCDDCLLHDNEKGIYCKDYQGCKKRIESKGYEVEKPKSRFDIAREYYLKNTHGDYMNHILFRELQEKFEEAIKELQEQIEKMKCCGNCIYGGYDNSEYCKRCDQGNYCGWELEE